VTRLKLRSDVALVLTCVGLFVAAAAQVRTSQGTALYVAVATVSAPVISTANAIVAAARAYALGRQDLEAVLAELGRLRREGTQLRLTNHVLTAEVAMMRQASRLLAAFPDLGEGSVLGRVVARDILGSRSLIVDRGRRDGVQLDAPVLGEGGVLGRIDRVTDNSARVQLLSHPAAAMAARLTEVPGEGLLVGGDQPRLTGFPPYTKIPTEAVVLTTGSEGIYPPGLVVGTTGEARNEGLFTLVPVILTANPAETATVLILRALPGAPR